MTPEIKTDEKLINHIRNVKLLTAIYGNKKFFIECYPTDEGAMSFPNSNRAVKEIELPNFDLFEEKLGYKWRKEASAIPLQEPQESKDELWEAFFNSLGMGVSKMHWQTINRKRVLENMDEYAKQEAIGFAEWMMQNDWKWEVDDLVGFCWYEENESGKSKLYTAVDLYELYQQQKENK